MEVTDDQRSDTQVTEDIETAEISNAYGDTRRSTEFSSENHKLEISNLSNNPNFHIVKTLLHNQLKLNPHKIRIGNRRAYVAFTSEQDRNDAIEKINNFQWKGKTLVAKPAAPRSDPFIKQTKVQLDVKRTDDADDEPAPVTDADVNSQVCPLWTKSYEDQIRWKENSIKSLLNIGKQLIKLCPGLKRDDPKLYQWTQDNSRICCKFDGVEPSPILDGYRNKCEFNVGRDGTIGFRMGRYKDRSERVVCPPKDCPILNRTMFKIRQTFQDFLNKSDDTKLRGFNHVTHEGNVRQLTIRTNRNDQSLVIVDLHPQSLTDEELETEIESIKTVFESVEEVVSVFFNISDRSHMNDARQTMRLASGQDHLMEYLEVTAGQLLKFRIGPTSFFQVNTRAAEVLYKSVAEFACMDSKSLLLDVGCGTGTIGLSLARGVSHVIGIELVESAVEDAKVNAQVNGIENVTYFAGRAEDLISESIKILKQKLSEQNNEGEIVAIVDPPRVGFNNSFVKVLRASNIKKIVYIACDPKSNSNLVSLCRPKSKAYQGNPFVPTRAKAFDLFPHTKFCELLLVYERLDMLSPDA